MRAGTSVSEEEAMGGYGRQVHYDRCFEGHDLSAAKLKYLLLKSLFDWILQSVFFCRGLAFPGFLEFPLALYVYYFSSCFLLFSCCTIITHLMYLDRTFIFFFNKLLLI